MRALWIVLVLAAAACTGSITGNGGDDSGGDDDGGDPPDAFPADEPPGLVGTTAAHNAARAAKGVAPLTWDPALAAIAQGWAEQCVDNSPPAGLIDHNPNRGATYPQSVGENIYGSGGAAATGVDAVESWMEEESDYDYASNTCSGICGHYTQIMWAATTKVGCGLHTCPGLTYGSSVVCNYAPAGNSGGRPY